MAKNLVNEIFLLRSLACLAVVIIHSINSVFANFGIRKVPEYMEINNVLFVIQILLMFGTPMFVFISEFILANAYKEKAPEGFFLKRIKFILTPFLVIGLCSSLIAIFQHDYISTGTILTTIYEQFLLGYFHGYFVLIIFQFYFLHFIFRKYIEGRFQAKYIVMVSIMINACYLAYYNFVEPITTFPFHMLFLAWIGYFAIAFYCGSNFNKFKLQLIKYRKIILATPILTGLIVLFFCYSGFLTFIQSKRVDIVFYTISLAFFLFYVGMQIKKVPNILIKISQYSFGIYLLHPFFQLFLENLFPNNYSLTSLVIYIIAATVIGLIGPVLSIIIFNKFKFGPYIVGKVGIGSNSISPKQFPKEKVYKKPVSY
ncbi:acyltransferase family protein [Halobacillus sp. A1]|uniref:acyltransferase family protein n=1 Tax=Halobacillus sp. A1 TaxID=2880262 RepID=UPI0020A69953|nr:acyltransferase family protein [Halobacillus sp. A1]MCP3032871.1 acyltransferase family protein [Halobacillus sp. A1]